MRTAIIRAPKVSAGRSPCARLRPWGTGMLEDPAAGAEAGPARQMTATDLRRYMTIPICWSMSGLGRRRVGGTRATPLRRSSRGRPIDVLLWE